MDAAAIVEKKTKDAAVEHKTNEKKHKKVAARANKAPFKPPRQAKTLGKPPGDEVGDEAGDEAGDDAGEARAGGGKGLVGEGSQPSKSGGKGRKKAITDQLTNVQEDDLCQWYKEHSFFYDKTDKEYCLTEKKKRVMTEMAMSLNLVYEDLLKYFASKRTQYRKLKQKKACQGASDKLLTHHQKWILDHYAHRHHHNSCHPPPPQATAPVGRRRR